MITHYQGQIIQYSEIGHSFGIADTTVRRYLDLLTETFMIRSLQPWKEDIKKRQVKHPKIYFRDSGIYHALLGVSSKKALFSHPKLGASWEGFALEQVLKYFHIPNEEACFWAVHSQGKLDLFFQKNGKRYGIEFKFSSSPMFSPSMKYAMKHLRLDHMYCFYPGSKVFYLHEKILACGL